ncbi:ovostatin-like [Dendropsophus ebraccatus]|uniref:ovostatin-like n=1 Tax=Dendropsophus ebraccatus TaxID=150705 RepID=UPI003831682F
MYLKVIILSAALLGFIAGGRAEPQCTFTISSLLESGETEKVCFMLKGHSEPVNVNFILKVSGVNHQVFNEQIPADVILRCFSFQAPSVTGDVPAFLTITAVGNNFNCEERRDVVVAQTDIPDDPDDSDNVDLSIPGFHAAFTVEEFVLHGD